MNRQFIEKLTLKALREQRETPMFLLDKLIRIVNKDKESERKVALIKAIEEYSSHSVPK